MVGEFIRRFSTYKVHRINEKTIKSLRKNICGGDMGIRYDDLAALYAHIINNNIHMDSVYFIKKNHPEYNLKANIIPKNSLDDFGFEFSIKGENARKIQILLRTNDRNEKSIFVSKHEQDRHDDKTIVTTYLFKNEISISGLGERTITPNTKREIVSLLNDLRKYFKFIFDNYHLY